MKKIIRVTKRQSSAARVFATELIKKLHKALKDKYKFNVRLVGSAKWNTILKVPGELWDVDYQLLLTHNSKIYKENKSFDPTKTKNDFFNYFNQLFNKKNGFKVQNSTTSITVINENSKYSIDFVIIKDENQIVRRNNNDKSGHNMFTWNTLPSYSKAYENFSALSPDEKVNLIENVILPRKVKEKAKSNNDITRKSSYEIFIEEVNNYVARKRNR